MPLFLFQTRCYGYNADVLDYPVCVNAIRCSSWGEGGCMQSSMRSIATRTAVSPEGGCFATDRKSICYSLQFNQKRAI